MNQEKSNWMDREATDAEIALAGEVEDAENRERWLAILDRIHEEMKLDDSSPDLPAVAALLRQIIAVSDKIQAEQNDGARMMLEAKQEEFISSLKHLPAWEPIWHRYFGDRAK